MNVVGIDVAKGKSTICFSIRGKLSEPYDISHTKTEFDNLESKIKALDGETKVVMESTGRYHIKLADHLFLAGIAVFVVNAILLAKFDNNSIRKAKTDRLDAMKIANYGKVHWNELHPYEPDDEKRQTLKMLSRQRTSLLKMRTELNNELVSLTDFYFPGINNLFNSKKTDGSLKWVDFLMQFHSAADVRCMKEGTFLSKYKTFCNKHGYRYSESKGRDVYDDASTVGTGRRTTEAERKMLETIASQLQSLNKCVESLSIQMDEIASELPEYEIVMGMYGVSKNIGPQLMAEIGNVRRFHSKKALIAYAGIDPPPHSSGQYDPKSRRISKRGSGKLRRILFLLIEVYMKNQATEEPIFQYMEKKMAEGKHYYVCIIAAGNKFLRQYYSMVKKHLDAIEEIHSA